MSEEQQHSAPSDPTPSQTSGNVYSQTEIVELLQKTIEQLDRVVNRLSTESIESLPQKTTLETLVASTEALAASLTQTEAIEEPLIQTTPIETPAPEVVRETIVEEESEELLPSEEIGIDRVLPSFNRLQRWWDGVLNRIRSLLPTSLEEKLSDWAITGFLAGVVVTLLLTSVWLLPQPTTEVAEAPVKTTPEASPEPTPVLETPPELKAPGRPKPVEVIAPPEPELTPEQSLIAAIQDQVAAITSQYPKGLVLSVEANFLGSRLIVTVGDDWYKINRGRQDKLVNSILERARKLDFRKLAIVNSQGNLLARNPVVGDKMVVLKREV
jgi:hypothetical protein